MQAGHGVCCLPGCGTVCSCPEVGGSKDKYVSRGQVKERLSCQAEKLRLFPGARGACQGPGKECLEWLLVRLLATLQKMSGPA